ncbi:MAG: nucleoside triphosphate pyrophosphohydrolase [Candidatus Zixiibacteriota bacterium]
MSSFYELVDIMKKLRGPEGCPWDIEQTHKSLIPYLLEETYEVIERIEEADPVKLKEELGDLLLQIVFHAQIASDEGEFDIEDISKAISDKLVRRHPHVFEKKADITPEQVTINWEHIKLEKDEPRDGERNSVLSGVPKSLPALLRAYRVQEKAARFGFDWEKVEDIIVKLDEETVELKSELADKNESGIIEELGDLLFTVVNVARFLKIDPERALNRITNKFKTRFEYIETRLAESDRTVADATLAEMDKLWDESKRR